MLIEYQIFKNENLLVHKFSGDWSLEHYKNYVHKSLPENNIGFIKKVLSDFRELNIQNALDQINELAKLREEQIRNTFLNVQIVSNPMATVITHLYHENLKSKGYNYEYCSTVKHALELLNINKSVAEIEDILKNLEYRF